MPVFIASEHGLVSQELFSDLADERATRKKRSVSTPFRGPTDFTPIGLNKPLTIRIAHVYTGRFPGKDRRNDFLLTSAIKAYSVFNAAPRAINFLTPDVPQRHSMTAPAAVDKGTPLVFYTPAVTDASLTLTLEMGFDRFPRELFTEISNGFQSIGQLPIFMPWSGFILAGAQLVRLIGDIGERLFESRAEFSRTETLDFALPGFDRPEAAFRILTNPGFDASGLTFSPRRGLVERGDPNKLYDGDEPYIVVSLDGAKDSQLEQFTPTLASAELLHRFFGSERKSSAAIDAIVEAAKLANDMKFRRNADQLSREIELLKNDGAEQGEIDKLSARRDALIENIGATELKPPKKEGADRFSGTTRSMQFRSSRAGEPEPVVEDPDHDDAADQTKADDVAPSSKRGPSGAARDWRIARSLDVLRSQINAAYPNRRRDSDGTIGDAAHASRNSDHNPYIIDGELGVVTAIDITHDLANGCDAGAIVDALIESRDPRIKYIIYNREIISSYPWKGTAAWSRRAYSGSNPHKRHFHLSVLGDKDKYDDESEWSIA